MENFKMDVFMMEEHEHTAASNNNEYSEGSEYKRPYKKELLLTCEDKCSVIEYIKYSDEDVVTIAIYRSFNIRFLDRIKGALKVLIGKDYTLFDLVVDAKKLKEVSNL